MKTVIENITPAKARDYLAMNRDNRPMRKNQVAYLVEQIKSGHWQVTHQGIAVSKSGRLLDGQHRLAAIVEANVACKMMVTTDMENEAYKVVDCGLKRSHSDRIHLVDNAAQNNLLCQVLNHYCRHALRVTHSAVPVSMIEDEFLRYSDSWLWLAGQFCPRPRVYGRSGVLAAIGVYHFIDKEHAAEFAAGYRTGENLHAGSPILALRRCLEGARDQPRDYWRAVSATRAHHYDKPLTRIYDATEDMLGNENSCRLINERSQKSIKAARNRYVKEAS